MLDRLRTPLVPALIVALLAMAPARWLGWTNDAAALVWLPLRPVAHLGAAAAGWLRPPTPVPMADAETLAAERDELLALVQRLRSDLEAKTRSIEVLEGLPRPMDAPGRPIAASVITTGPDGIATLNVGRRHGVSPGDPVLAFGGRLVGRVGEPVDANACVLVPASHAAGGGLRVRLVDEQGSDDSALCLLEPIGNAWTAEVDATRVAIGASVRLDDPAWAHAAQGLLLGRVAGRAEVPERPLRARIRVVPAWRVGDGGVLAVHRTSAEATP